jgi:hypothetical protein
MFLINLLQYFYDYSLSYIKLYTYTAEIIS